MTTVTRTFSGSQAIPDQSTITNVLAVSGVAAGAVITSISVTGLNITHTWNADLDISLIDPDGNVIDLSSDNGGSGDNYTNTTFSDAAATAITAGTSPFTGSFRPEQSFASLFSGAINGNWTLRIVDDARFDVGTLTSWTIQIVTNEAPTLTSTDVIVDENTTLVMLTATDPDVPAQSLTYSIAGGEDAALFTIVGNELRFVAAPNAESPPAEGVTPGYQVSIQVSDGAGGTDIRTVTVEIADVDEFDVTAPVDINVAVNAIAENATGVVGITASAVDADATTNAVTYSLVTDLTGTTLYSGGQFAVGAASGVVTALTAFDYETDPLTHTIYVRATSADGSFTVTQFTIAITDVEGSFTGSGLLTGTSEEDTFTATGAATMLGLAGDDTMIGSSGNDSMEGGADRDRLTGNAGNDYLDGGAGNDTMTGGLGDDTYVVDSAGDVVTETGDTLGVDEVWASITFDLNTTPNVEHLTLTGGAAIDGTGNARTNRLTGNTAANTLLGNGGVDFLYGMGGDDSLDGGIGNDLIDGGTGADTMIGGAGSDAYFVDDAGDVVIETDATSAGGIDTVYAAVDHTLTSNVERLVITSSAGHSGTGNELANRITGNSGDDTLSGLAGRDTLLGLDGDDSLSGGADIDVLDGGSGVDTMAGGDGGDSYYVDDSNDVIIEAAGTAAGIDHVFASATYTLSSNVEYLTLTGAGTIDGTGNNLNNIIKGNGAANTLLGLDGNDTLQGFGGDDVLEGGLGKDALEGGAGDDTMTGGAGDDRYTVDSLGDVVIEVDGGGRDTVYVTVDGYTLPDFVETFMLSGSGSISGSGNAAANTMVGNAGNNALSGLGGNDVLDGGLGDDTLDGGAGNDTLSGRGGADVFRFAGAFERDTVSDFQLALDRLDMTALGITTAAGFAANAAQVSANVVWNDGAGNIITLRNVSLAGITDAHFVL